MQKIFTLKNKRLFYKTSGQYISIYGKVRPLVGRLYQWIIYADRKAWLLYKIRYSSKETDAWNSNSK